MSDFQVKEDLPKEEREEIERILAIDSTMRSTTEIAYLASRLIYQTNRVIRKDTDGLILEAEGNKVPQGDSGFKQGARFYDLDETGNNVLVNTGDETTAVFSKIEVVGYSASVSPSASPSLSPSVSPSSSGSLSPSLSASISESPSPSSSTSPSLSVSPSPSSSESLSVSVTPSDSSSESVSESASASPSSSESPSPSVSESVSVSLSVSPSSSVSASESPSPSFPDF